MAAIHLILPHSENHRFIKSGAPTETECPGHLLPPSPRLPLASGRARCDPSCAACCRSFSSLPAAVQSSCPVSSRGPASASTAPERPLPADRVPRLVSALTRTGLVGCSGAMEGSGVLQWSTGAQRCCRSFLPGVCVDVPERPEPGGRVPRLVSALTRAGSVGWVMGVASMSRGALQPCSPLPLRS